jgi:hypothetical protein
MPTPTRGLRPPGEGRTILEPVCNDWPHFSKEEFIATRMHFNTYEFPPHPVGFGFVWAPWPHQAHDHQEGLKWWAHHTVLLHHALSSMTWGQWLGWVVLVLTLPIWLSLVLSWDMISEGPHRFPLSAHPQWEAHFLPWSSSSCVLLWGRWTTLFSVYHQHDQHLPYHPQDSP